MAFTNETKYGYTDGEQIGSWGDGFPIFARVVSGELYAVAREDSPSQGARFGKMYYVSRDWMKAAIFSATKSDADLFSDRPNNMEDTSVAGNQFIKSSDTSQVLKRPNPNAGATTPPTPVSTSAVIPELPPPTPTPPAPVAGPKPPVTPTPKAKPSWTKPVLIGVIVLAAGVALYFGLRLVKKK